MNEVVILILALLFGLILGVFFFGGLWWTVKKGVTSSHPAMVFLISLFLRTAVVLLGFYYIGHERWERLLVCFLGFIIARFVVNRIVRSKGIPLDNYSAEGITNEP